ncbi:rhomboid family intramembrane serine protease GlpG [Alishewanella sp. HL-SH06]|uniref:rhomboid family intramembrane serine protease GlpG n=1 Tax=Alishewanella sp. HL-SH06 TaxID=3461144 RepID=UPI0040416453
MTMHKFVAFESAIPARLFADYCTSKGLQVELEQEGQTTTLAAPAEQLSQIEPLLKQFLTEPDHARYQAAAWQQSRTIATSGKRPSLRWSQLLQSPVTSLIVLLVCLIYLWQQLSFQAANSALMLTEPAQIWRWITPILLHFSLTHIVFNLCWWFLLGQKIEQRAGSALLIQLTLSSALLSNGLQLALVGPDFGGLSGVVYALFGYCWLSDKLAGKHHYPVTDGLAAFMLLWLALGFMDVLWVNMANWAHLGGLACGLIWAVLRHSKQPV